MVNVISILTELLKAPQVTEENLEKIKFIGQLLVHCDETKAQLGQDIFAAWASGFPEYGYAVEFGASDGVTGNNTYMLENTFQWQCLLAEPNPAYHESIRNKRKAILETSCVYDVTGTKIQFHQVPADHSLSTISGFGHDDEHANKRTSVNSIAIDTITLYDMLKKNYAPYFINYISVDTEGTELVILRKFFEQNDSYNVKAWTVEHNYVPSMQKGLDDLFRANGYRKFFPEFTSWDSFYVKD